MCIHWFDGHQSLDLTFVAVTVNLPASQSVSQSDLPHLTIKLLKLNSISIGKMPEVEVEANLHKRARIMRTPLSLSLSLFLLQQAKGRGSSQIEKWLATNGSFAAGGDVIRERGT